MNLFDLGGQYLRVGKAITPPNALLGPSTGSSVLPTAAAGRMPRVLIKIFRFATFNLISVAAAAATAKIQAMDAVASNAVALGLSNLSKNTTPISTVTPSTVVLPGGVVAATAPTTLATLSAVTVAAPAIIPPPGIAIPQITPDKKIQPAIVTPIVNAPQV